MGGVESTGGAPGHGFGSKVAGEDAPTKQQPWFKPEGVPWHAEGTVTRKQAEDAWNIKGRPRDGIEEEFRITAGNQIDLCDVRPIESHRAPRVPPSGGILLEMFWYVCGFCPFSLHRRFARVSPQPVLMQVWVS